MIQRYKSAPCHLDVTIDESAKAYLRQFGFIPKLGARPLKALIEKKITGTLANALFLGTIQPDSSVRVVYRFAYRFERSGQIDLEDLL